MARKWPQDTEMEEEEVWKSSADKNQTTTLHVSPFSHDKPLFCSTWDSHASESFFFFPMYIVCQEMPSCSTHCSECMIQLVATVDEKCATWNSRTTASY